MPYILLTDIMKEYNKDRTRNTEISVNQQIFSGMYIIKTI